MTLSLVAIEAEGESSASSVTGGWREHLETFRKDGRRTSLSIAFRGTDIPCRSRRRVVQVRRPHHKEAQLSNVLGNGDRRYGQRNLLD